VPRDSCRARRVCLKRQENLVYEAKCKSTRGDEVCEEKCKRTLMSTEAVRESRPISMSHGTYE